MPERREWLTSPWQGKKDVWVWDLGFKCLGLGAARAGSRVEAGRGFLKMWGLWGFGIASSAYLLALRHTLCPPLSPFCVCLVPKTPAAFAIVFYMLLGRSPLPKQSTRISRQSQMHREGSSSSHFAEATLLHACMYGTMHALELHVALVDCAPVLLLT